MQQFYHKYFILCLALLAFVSCRKPKLPQPSTPSRETTELRSGIPENIQSIDGYFYALQDDNKFSAFACLRDPSGNLMEAFNHRDATVSADQSNNGNINVENITFCSKQLFTMGTNNLRLYYTFNSSSNIIDSIPYWQTGNNQSFLALNQQITRNYPLIIGDSILEKTIYRSSALTYTISTIAQNFDSLLITITDDYYNEGKTSKKVMPGQLSVTFSPADLSKLHATAGNAIICIQAFNYSWKLHNGKKYVFELARKRAHWVGLI